MRRKAPAWPTGLGQRSVGGRRLRQLADEAASESLLFGRHFCRRAIHHIEIPWPIDRDKKQVSVGPNPCLVNHFARHVVVATRTYFFLFLSAIVLHDPGAVDNGVRFVGRMPMSWRMIIRWAPDHELCTP